MAEDRNRKTSRSRLDELVNRLREDIISGRLSPGDFLPSEREFAKRYQLSNISVRKGLEILVNEGLISKIPRVGNEVIGPPGADGLIHLNFGYHSSIPREAAIDQLLEQFHELYPHIRVNALAYANEHPMVVKQFMENGLFDVITVNYDHYCSYKENSMLDVLEPLKPDPEIYPFLTEAYTAGQKLYVQPFLFSPVILCYNREHFTEQNMHEPDASWNWEKLFETALKLSQPGERLGFYFHFLSANRWTVFLLQRGGAFERGPDSRIRIAGTEMAEAFRFCRNIQEHFPALSSKIGNGDAEQLFAQGKVSMLLTSYTNLNFLKDKPVTFELSPVPHFGDPKTLLMSIGLAVSRHSQQKEAALALVRFLTSYDAQLAIRQKTYSLPACKPAAEWQGKEQIFRPSRFSLFREIIPSFRHFTALNIGNRELRIIERDVRLYWAGLENENDFFSRMEELLSDPEYSVAVI
jgi:multiple sugar transport system substrate-binding protein